MNTPDVLTVSQLNFYIKSIIDEDINLRTVFLCAEISNFTNHVKSGHFYLTLKDKNSSIKAVMFKMSAQRLKFIPENGMSVLVRGRISVFEKTGQYQLYIDDMQPDGLGSFNLAFEQLKERLSKEGLFDESFKKPLPSVPQKIGVVTSPTGAAIKDILNVLQRRFPCTQVILYPVQVQGEKAPIEIATALRDISQRNNVDVIILGRGGGSIEELWAFNDELVARAIFDCQIPVISGVGHETDFTIADFVSDLRAPTPSAAAELAVPSKLDEQKKINMINNLCYNLICSKINRDKERLGTLLSKSFMKSPLQLLDNRRMILDSYNEKINNLISNSITDSKYKFSILVNKLDALSPLKVMLRGYSITTKENDIVKSVNDIEVGDSLKIKLSDGYTLCEVKNKERV